MSTIEEAFNSPQAQYLGKIIDIDPTAKYANMTITKPERGWQKVEYWIKSENLGGDVFFQPPHPTLLYEPLGQDKEFKAEMEAIEKKGVVYPIKKNLYDPHGIAEKGTK